jgi:ATP-dependent DNA helicase DinG
MLDALADTGTPEHFVDWFEIEKSENQIFNIGMYRHWVDPMQPFAQAIRPHAHGIAVTSATLRDGTGDDDHDWHVARRRTGASHIAGQAREFAARSPFDYAAATRVLVIDDINRDEPAQVAHAYRALIEASGGGALGLFTAVNRLARVHREIAPHLESAGLPLYAQHMEGLNPGTLVDMFRADRSASLLGTDAVRDGVDVPGDSLRLLVFDRVPWPRPTILHKARRREFGGKAYDDMITRLKLKQAYGRLIRRADDRGVFVMLDNRLPSRLHGAFPGEVEVTRIGLKEAVDTVSSFLG